MLGGFMALSATHLIHTLRSYY